MKRSKKLLSLLLVLMMLTAIFAGCGTKATDIPDDDTPLSAGDVAGNNEDSAQSDDIRAAAADPSPTPTTVVPTAFSGGSGTQADPYQIASVADLTLLATNVNSGTSYANTYFTMTANIALTSAWTPIGGNGSTTNSFCGVFNGNGNTVSGLSITSTNDHIGLFGCIGTSTSTAATVQNLTVSGSVSGNKNTGAVVGTNYGSVIGCINNATVSSGGISQGVGGVVGSSWGTGSAVSSCQNNGAVTGTASTTYTGGIVGKAEGSVTGCTNNSSADVGGVNYTGGVIGFLTGTQSGNTNNGSVHISTTGGFTGPIVGLAVTQAAGGTITVTDASPTSYVLTANTTFVISTSNNITLTGNGTAYAATITFSPVSPATTMTTSLTISDLLVSQPISTGSVIDYTSTSSNTLTLVGTSDLENNNVAQNSAVIHVPSTPSLTINGSGTLYIYKNSLGSGIGANTSEANGAITISNGNIFIKGSKTGALIGNDLQTAAVTTGDITINGGNLNLVTVAQGAGIGGSRLSGAGNVYVTNGNLTLVTDFSGPVIGAGANLVTTSGANGYLYVTGGSIKTMITSNAYSSWGVTGTSPGYVISDAALTATKLNAVGGTAVYQCIVPGAATNTVTVDGATFYTGGLHGYLYTSNSSTQSNWSQTSGDTNLYLYLTGANHLLNVNGTYYVATWNSTTSSFTLSSSPTVTINSGDSLSTDLSGLTGPQIIAVNGTPVTGTTTIALTNQQVIVRGSSFTGDLFDVNSGDNLTITSGVIADTTPNISVSVNGGSFTITPTAGSPFQIGGVINLASGSVINIGATVANVLGSITVQSASPSSGLTIASRVSPYSLTNNDSAKFTYVGAAWKIALYLTTQLRLQSV